MSIPGGVGGLNSVGAIYVSVLTDTSGMKGEIEDAAKKGGAAGNRQFNKSWQEEQNKHADDLLFSKAVEARMKKSAKRFGKEFSNSLVTGIGDPKLNIDRMVSDDLTKIADKFGKLPKDVKEQWEGQFKGILSRQMDQEIAKVERSMGGFGRNIGDVIGDSLKKSDFDRDLKVILTRVAQDVRNGVSGSTEDIFKKFGAEFDRLSKDFNVPVVDIAGQIEKQLPAAMKDLEKLAEKQRLEQEKTNKAAIALNEKLEKARLASEEKVQKEALRLEEKTLKESARLQEKAERETLRLREKTERETIRIKEKADRDAARVLEKEANRREKEGGLLSGLFKVDRATLGLFRAGSPNSPFGALTGGFALVTGAANLAFRAVSLFPKLLEGVGKGFVKLGGILGKFSGTLGKIFGGLGAGIAKLATNPFVLIGTAIVGLIAGAGVLVKGLGIVIAAFKAVIGIMTLFAGAAFYTAASLVIVASAATSLVIGLGIAKLGMEDTLSAVKALNQGLATGDWDAYNDAMKKLGPNAQAAVKSLRPFLQALQDIRKPLGEKIFANLGTVVSAAGKQFGFLKEFILDIGIAINDVLIRFAALGGNIFFVESIRTLMGAAIPIIVNFGKAASDAFAGVVNVLAIVAPLAVQFSEKVAGLAERFRLFTESGAGHTAIEGFFERAWTIANIVWDIIKKVGEAIFSVLGRTYAENSGPNGFLMKIQGTLDRLLTWINANPDSINTWFGDASTTASNIWDAIGKIGEVIDELDTPENMASLQAVIKAFGSLATVVNTIASAVKFITGANLPGAGAVGSVGSARQLYQQKADEAAKRDTRLAPPGQRLRHAAGGMIRQKELAWLGESGPELVIPLRRPLGLIDPEARPAAKMLQDMKRAPQSTGPTKVVNLTQNITPVQSDPKAVAASVINRAVALARV